MSQDVRLVSDGHKTFKEAVRILSRNRRSAPTETSLADDSSGADGSFTYRVLYLRDMRDHTITLGDVRQPLTVGTGNGYCMHYVRSLELELLAS